MKNKLNEKWSTQTGNAFIGTYDLYFTPQNDEWILEIYGQGKDGSICIGKKKCHQWHKTEYFDDIVFNVIVHPDDSNFDCAYLD